MCHSHIADNALSGCSSDSSVVENFSRLRQGGVAAWPRASRPPHRGDAERGFGVSGFWVFVFF